MHLDFLEANNLEPLAAFLTSLALGLLIGLERERNPSAKAGLRTFALVAMFGTLAAFLAEQTGSPWTLPVGLALVGAMMIAAYARDKTDAVDPGTTTVAAVIVCYALGALIWYGYGTLAVMLGVTTTMLLYFKPELRGLSQNLSRRDMFSILQFAVLSFVILPILPDRDYGPYSALNPHQIWLMVVLISGISLSGYIALRLIGGQHGTLLLGFLGGLVSSTATTLVYARHARSQESVQLSTVVILTAGMVVLVRLSVLAGVVAPAILGQLIPVLGGGLVCGAAGGFYWWRKLGEQAALPMPEVSNPTEIRSALGFGALYATVLFCAAWLADTFGSGGLYAVALISGLTDVDAITLSTLRLYNLGKLAPLHAIAAILLAVISNIMFKMGLVFFVGGKVLARRCALPMLAIAAGAGVVYGFLLI
jgi:uncharacterized membrane protein (DUF4010 family)